MAQPNNEPQSTNQPRNAFGKRTFVQPTIPVDSTGTTKSLDEIDKILAESQDKQASTHFSDIGFSGFLPFDQGASLFRRWTGDFLAKRSDGEVFYVQVAFLQTDTPFTTGPIVSAALAKLMEYRGCMCRPSASLVCHVHAENEGEI